MSKVKKVHIYKRDRGYSEVCNQLRDDISLSDSAFRILVWLLNRPEGWDLNTKSIATQRGYSISKVASISKELQLAGYLMIERFADGSTEWHVSEVRGTFENERLAKRSQGLLKSRSSRVVKKQTADPHSKNQNEVKSQLVTDEFEPHSEKPNLAFHNASVSKDISVRKDIYISPQADQKTNKKRNPVNSGFLDVIEEQQKSARTNQPKQKPPGRHMMPKPANLRPVPQDWTPTEESIVRCLQQNIGLKAERDDVLMHTQRFINSRQNEDSLTPESGWQNEFVSYFHNYWNSYGYRNKQERIKRDEQSQDQVGFGRVLSARELAADPFVSADRVQAAFDEEAAELEKAYTIDQSPDLIGIFSN